MKYRCVFSSQYYVKVALRIIIKERAQIPQFHLLPDLRPFLFRYSSTNFVKNNRYSSISVDSGNEIRCGAEAVAVELLIVSSYVFS